LDEKNDNRPSESLVQRASGRSPKKRRPRKCKELGWKETTEMERTHHRKGQLDVNEEKTEKQRFKREGKNDDQGAWNKPVKTEREKGGKEGDMGKKGCRKKP